jgi:hypothetical protein
MTAETVVVPEFKGEAVATGAIEVKNSAPATWLKRVARFVLCVKGLSEAHGEQADIPSRPIDDVFRHVHGTAELATE